MQCQHSSRRQLRRRELHGRRWNWDNIKDVIETTTYQWDDTSLLTQERSISPERDRTSSGDIDWEIAIGIEPIDHRSLDSNQMNDDRHHEDNRICIDR